MHLLTLCWAETHLLLVCEFHCVAKVGLELLLVINHLFCVLGSWACTMQGLSTAQGGAHGPALQQALGGLSTNGATFLTHIPTLA